MEKRKKLGSNDPCWCGSGKKHRKCHLGREQQDRLPHWEIGKQFREDLNHKMCSCPESMKAQCNGFIVKAHTVSKSASLQHIARDGHVYQITPNFLSLKNGSDPLKLKLVGTNLASTFTGFCKKHDNEIFAPIEKQQFRGAPEQCFLVAYRALCREVFIKESAARHLPTLQELDRGRDLQQQIEIQSLIAAFALGTRAGLQSIRSHKTQYDTCFAQQDFSSVQYYCLRFDTVPDVMGSGGIFPVFDFDGHQLQDLSDVSYCPNVIFFSVFSADGSGWFVCSWLKESAQASTALVSSFDRLEDREKPNAIVRFLFELCENIYLSPPWWEQLPDDTKRTLFERTYSGSVIRERKPHCLTPDGLSYVQWKIAEKINNLHVTS